MASHQKMACFLEVNVENVPVHLNYCMLLQMHSTGQSMPMRYVYINLQANQITQKVPAGNNIASMYSYDRCMQRR